MPYARICFSFLCRGMDSYQDRDLADLRDEWLKALERRKNHLDKQIKVLANKDGTKSDRYICSAPTKE